MEAGKVNVLLVEDNHMNRILVKEVLSLRGYEITEVNTGIEAIKALADKRPDIILMDINLPGMDGITATRIIRSEEGNSGIPILALTASAMKGEEEEILSHGFDGYVSKPIEVKRLLESVDRLLKKG
jgi:CheY-like chemotaxis protein